MKITASKKITKDLDKFIGKSTIIKFKIITTTNNEYESELQMPVNWKYVELARMITDIFHMCDGIPSSVHILEAVEDISKMN